MADVPADGFVWGLADASSCHFSSIVFRFKYVDISDTGVCRDVHKLSVFTGHRSGRLSTCADLDYRRPNLRNVFAPGICNSFSLISRYNVSMR